jgi:PDZ domain/Protein of unknown function (DUF1570)
MSFLMSISFCGSVFEKQQDRKHTSSCNNCRWEGYYWDVRTRHLIRAILSVAMLLGAAPAGFAAPAEEAQAEAAQTEAARGNPSARAASTRAATRPATRPSEVDRRKLRQLSRQALGAAKAGRLEEAEKSLGQALVIDPHHSTNLYNMACVKALRGRHDAAIDYLERAAVEGFTDFMHVEKDPDLAPLRKLERYKQFIARKDEWQRKAADKVISVLRREFGAGYLYEVDESAKLIFATNTDAQTLAATKKWLGAQARSQWEQLFANRPDQYVSIILPSAADYREIVSRPGVGGFYNHENRILIAQRLGQIMTHEFTHALHAADLDASGQEHPIWLMEGIATMYEASQFEGDVLVPADNFRLSALKSAARSGRLIPFDKMLKMEQRAFVGNATIAYGQAGSLLLYLYEKGKLRTFYDAFKAGYEHDKTGAKALEEVTEMPLALLEREWKAWMLQRTPPVLATGANGPVLGVRFGSGNDGLKIDQVFAAGPAAKAGMKVGDVIVGIEDVDTRDQQSFVPLLAMKKPGERVKLKVRRGQEYLDVVVMLVERNTIAWGPETRATTRPGRIPASRR